MVELFSSINGTRTYINYIQFIQKETKNYSKRRCSSLNEEKEYLVIDEIYDTGYTFS